MKHPHDYRTRVRASRRIATNEPNPVTWIVLAGFLLIFGMMAWPIFERVWEMAK